MTVGTADRSKSPSCLKISINYLGRPTVPNCTFLR